MLVRAIGLLAADTDLHLLRVSSVYETAPVGYLDQPAFLNMAVALRTACEPLALLHRLQAIELALGRQRPFPDAPRTIDLDLLTGSGIMLATAELTLPHARLLARQFVLVPLAEIAPELRVGDSLPVGQLAEPRDPDVVCRGRLRDVLRSES